MTARFSTLCSLRVFSFAALVLCMHPALAQPQKIVSQGLSYSVDQHVPTWVAPISYSQEWHPDVPWYYELNDSQFSLIGRDVEHYAHVIRVINSAQGMSDASQIAIYFDPSYQTLTVHEIAIVRGKKKINVLNNLKLRLMQREERLNESIYDGHVTATMVIPDLRNGDKIAYSYTIHGDNPSLKGHFVNVESAAVFKAPIEHYSLQVFYPKERHLFHQYKGKSLTIQEREKGNIRILDVHGDRMELPNWDAVTPLEEALSNVVEVSEFADWGAVAKWGTELFAGAGEADRSVQEKAESIKQEGGSLVDQATRALDFVQKDIRYLGVELGQYSHLPEKPAKVLSQRYGDCKDKSLLLISLLKELGIEAKPVLASPGFEKGAQGRLPSPYAFSHAIVLAHIDGKEYWLDPTRSYQYGPLSERQASYGAGLVLSDTTTGLSELPAVDSNQLAISREATFKVADFIKPAEFQVSTVYYGEQAEMLRAYMASINKEEFGKLLLQEYTRLYPKINRVVPIDIADDKSKNTVTLSEKYEVPEFFDYPNAKFLLTNLAHLTIAPMLRIDNRVARKFAYIFGKPGRVEERIRLELPENIVEKEISDKKERIDSAFFTLKEDIHWTKQSIVSDSTT